MVLAALSGTCTILTACSKFLVADRKKAGHKRFAKLFQTLLIRLLRCETVVEYNALKHELTEAIIREPLVLIWNRRKNKAKLNYTMTARLALVCIAFLFWLLWCFTFFLSPPAFARGPGEVVPAPPPLSAPMCFLINCKERCYQKKLSCKYCYFIPGAGRKRRAGTWQCLTNPSTSI